jgi:hypothetical protein
VRDTVFIARGNNIYCSEGSQAMPARPSAYSSLEARWLKNGRSYGHLNSIQ